MTRKKGKGYFSISAVAKMFSVHQQTIRMYEKEGLISPKRSDGNTRLFSEDDIERLEEVIYLTHTLGINLAGVEMILKLKKQIKKMQKEMNDLFKQAHQELEREAEASKALLQRSTQSLIALKRAKISPERPITPALCDKSTTKNNTLNTGLVISSEEEENDFRDLEIYFELY